jgi:hypothetical protein
MICVFLLYLCLCSVGKLMPGKYVDCKNKPCVISTKSSLHRKAKVLAVLTATVECYNKIRNTDSIPADLHSLYYVSEPINVDMDEVTPWDDFYMEN